MNKDIILFDVDGALVESGDEIKDSKYMSPNDSNDIREMIKSELIFMGFHSKLWWLNIYFY